MSPAMPQTIIVVCATAILKTGFSVMLLCRDGGQISYVMWVQQSIPQGLAS